MGLSANTHWDVRPATGSDNNGGGFVQGATGTDYSQQASPQYALTGIASAGAGNVVLSAAAAADMVGNIAKVISGTNFTTGFFEILSVVAGVSITFSTNKAGTAICTGAGASGVINIGGSLASVTVLAVNTPTNAFNGNVIWVKGTITATAELQPDSHLTYAGYGTTHGDGVRAGYTTATNSTPLFQVFNQHEARFGNFNFSNTATTRDIGFVYRLNYGAYFTNCSFDGFSNAVQAGLASVIADTEYSLHFIDCEIKNSTSTAGAVQLFQPVAMLFHGCYIHHNAGDGVRLDGTGATGTGAGLVVFQNTVFDTNAGKGVNITSASVGGQPARSWFYNNCVFYNNGSDGVKYASATWPEFIRVSNCIFYLNGGFGFFRDTTTDLTLTMFPSANAYGSNTSGARGGIWPASPAANPDVTLTADPFTNAAGGDFTLNGTAGGGAALKAVGYESNVI